MRGFSPHGLLCSLKLACTCVPAAQHICQPPRAYSYPPCSHLMGRCRIIHDYEGTHILFWSVLHHCTMTSWAAGHERNPHYEVLFMRCKYIYIRLNTWFISSVWSLLFFIYPSYIIIHTFGTSTSTHLLGIASDQTCQWTGTLQQQSFDSSF